MPRTNPYLTEQLRARLAALSEVDLSESGRPGGSTPDDESISDDAGQTATAAGPSVFRRWTAGRHFTRTHVVVIAVLVTVAVVFAGWTMLRARDHAVGVEVPITVEPNPGNSHPGEPSPGPTSSSSPLVDDGPTEPVPTTITVHVVGEVTDPGVVELPDGARVGEAIAAAGGLTDDAVPGRLNLAQRLHDGEQVFVSSRADPPSEVMAPDGSPGGGGNGGGGSAGPGDGEGAQVNLNAATAEQLETLPGVGPATAQAILAWRENHGRFTSIEELQEVEGIGPKTFARLKSLVTV